MARSCINRRLLVEDEVNGAVAPASDEFHEKVVKEALPDGLPLPGAAAAAAAAAAAPLDRANGVYQIIFTLRVNLLKKSYKKKQLIYKKFSRCAG